MVNPEVVRRKLEKLDKYLSYLEKIQSHSEKRFLDTTEIWASSERFLQMAVESINDIASHIIAEENLGTINQYRDLPEILHEKGLIDDELEAKWIQIIGFRNILVHGYAEIDRAEVFKIIQHNLDDLRTLQKVFANML